MGRETRDERFRRMANEEIERRFGLVKEPVREDKVQEVLERTVLDHESVLDVGCGTKQRRGFGDEIVTVDAWRKVDPDYRVDLNRQALPFLPDSFDVVLLLNVLEHLYKESGKRVLKQCQKIARRCVVVLTPLQWDEDPYRKSKDAIRKNPYRVRESLWSAEDFKNYTRLLPDDTEFGSDAAYFCMREMRTEE